MEVVLTLNHYRKYLIFVYYFCSSYLVRDFIHVDRPCEAFAYVFTREKRQMNVYGITWSCVERQEVRLVKINHSHKFKTYAGASSEAIYWFWKPRDRLAAGPMILFIVESSCKINKEGKYTQKLSSVVASLPAPCESVESARARNKRRLSNHARGTRRARKKRSKWVTERLLSEGVH